MKINFSINVDREKKSLETKACCPQCKEEVQMERVATMLKFKCTTHGDIGAMSVAEFQHAAESAEKSVAEREGFSGKPQRQEYFIPTDSQKMS
jgi:ribosomal protein L37AE/L43A